MKKSNVVFTNGCFDVLHKGHVSLLNFCKSLGDKVVVGLNSDSSVARLKGPSRPVNTQEDRKFVLEGLSSVDEVIVFHEDTPYDLIKSIKPDIIVKGGDYVAENVVGSDLAKVVIFDYMPGYSSTNLIKGGVTK